MEEKIIAIDHGFGNIKTVNFCFKTGVSQYNIEPSLVEDVLQYNGNYYVSGEGHKEFKFEKTHDSDYFILSLIAIAKELELSKIYRADVHIAAGLPTAWINNQRKEFKRYLMQKDKISFVYNKKHYHINISGVDIFPQGYTAVLGQLSKFNGSNMLIDIGNGTMNIMYIEDKKPIESKCWTEKLGTYQCVLKAKSEALNHFGYSIEESIIERILIEGTANISEEYIEVIRNAAKGYGEQIFRTLREKGYNPDIMKLHIVGGGGCIIRNFMQYDKNQISIEEDIHATVKGYEYAASMKKRKNMRGK